MRKWFLVLMAVLFLAGCGASAKQSGLYEHSSLYKDWDHMKFSLFGYKSVTADDAKKSKEQGWWGVTAGEPTK